MQRANQLKWTLPLASALMLAACGGEGGTPSDRQAGSIGAVRDPVDTGKFIALAQNDTCADIRNRLFLIDGQYVFADRAGSCRDASYTYTLYGSTPEPALCAQADSIAGPRLSCTDYYSKALLDTIVAHLDAPDLGLGSAHKVEPIKFTVQNPSFVEVDWSSYSRSWSERNVVIKDAASWAKLWQEYAGDERPLPPIDFTTTMVLGVFMGSAPSGCYSTAVTGLTRKDGKLVATRTDFYPSKGSMCTMAITFPAQLVRTARSDEPVEFVTVVSNPD